MKARGKGYRWLHRLAYIASVAVVVLCWLAVALEVWLKLTPIDRDEIKPIENSVRIYDRGGNLLREAINGSGERAQWASLESINPLVVAATVAVEDHRFYQHDGVDGIAVSRAFIDNLREGRVVSGASTITMQLAKLLRPRHRTLLAKISESMTARRLEAALSKDEILEQYLNRAPYGGNTIGIEAASKRYFGKSTSLLSLAEAALLAGLPKGPSVLNPLRYPAAAKKRQLHVLRRMLATSAAPAGEIERAMREPLVYEDPARVWRAEHFTDYVLAKRARSGRIDTTLDLQLQSRVADAVREHVASLAESGATNAAAIVLDNERCEIRAMVGSADYFAKSTGMVNGALALRQPGSTLKPFTFALALEKGATPATVVADVATHYGTAKGDLFSPQNYSKEFTGPVMMGSALGRSLNIPAMRVAADVGPDKLLERLRAAGFASLSHSAAHYGLGLTLGNGEVTLLELAQGYAMFAREGLGCQATAFSGANAGQAQRVIPQDVAFLITDILSNESFRIAAFGPANSLLLGFPVAVKTGTSSNWRDGWAVGYTRDLTVAVWTGDFDNRSMNHIGGAAGAGPLFNRIMTAAVGDRATAVSPMPVPESIAEVSVCALSGQRPHEDCPHSVEVRMDGASVPDETCSWHRRVAIDTRNGLRAGDGCPAEYVEHRIVEQLPPEYNAWVARHNATEPPPSRYSPLCPRSGAIEGVVSIRYPRDGERFLLEPGYERNTQTLELSADVVAGAGPVEWRVNGTVVARAEWPHHAAWRLEPGHHTISAHAKGLRSATVEIEVR